MAKRPKKMRTPRKSDPPNTPDDYEVGYCKPPLHTRFQEGRSGNNKGRAKGKLNLITSVLKALAERMDITEHGRSKRITKLDVGGKHFSNYLAKGEPWALKQLFAFAPLLGLTGTTEADAAPPSAADEQVLAQMLLRVQQAASRKTPPGPQTPADPADTEADHGD